MAETATTQAVLGDKTAGNANQDASNRTTVQEETTKEMGIGKFRGIVTSILIVLTQLVQVRLACFNWHMSKGFPFFLSVSARPNPEVSVDDPVRCWYQRVFSNRSRIRCFGEPKQLGGCGVSVCIQEPSPARKSRLVRNG